MNQLLKHPATVGLILLSAFILLIKGVYTWFDSRVPLETHEDFHTKLEESIRESRDREEAKKQTEETQDVTPIN